jgi:hypothetical protein
MVGRETESIAQMTEGLAAFRSTGTVAFLPCWLIRLAEAYGKAQRPLEGYTPQTSAKAKVKECASLRASSIAVSCRARA